MKILIVHAGFGEGHRRAACGVASFLKAPCFDLLDFCPKILKKISQAHYIYATSRTPFLWKLIFDFFKLSLPRLLLGNFNKIIFHSFTRYLYETKPDIIITTHFFPAHLAAFLKKETNAKIICIVTDLRAHPLWFCKSIDTYITPSPEAKSDLMALGAKESSIFPGYISLRAGFLNKTNTADLRKKFSLPDKPGMLFVSSIRGEFPFLKESLGELAGKFNIFVISGKNQGLKTYLEGINNPGVRVFSFYEDMWELVDLSDIIVSKPGGMTIFEGIFKKKFFIFTHFIRGQEEENMKMLIKDNVARYAGNKKEFMEAAAYFSARKNGLEERYPLKFTDIREIIQKIIDYPNA